MTNIGIDVSKKTLDVCVLTADAKEFYFTCANDEIGFAELDTFLSSFNDIKICLEATSIYHRHVADYLSDAHYFVCVENPAKIHYFVKMQMSRLKTDKHDAYLIAQYCAYANLKQYKRASDSVVKLNELVSMLQHLKRVRAAELTKLHDVSVDLRCVLKRVIDCFNAEIEHVTLLIDELIAFSAELKQSYLLIKSVPAIGATTAAVLLSVLTSKQFETSSQFVAFLGLNPSSRQSGSSVLRRERISKIGKSDLRAALYMPALAAFRYNLYSAFMSRLIDANKTKRVIITALMRKLAVYAFTVFKKQEQFKIIS